MSWFWEGKGFRQREQLDQRPRVKRSYEFQNKKQFSVAKALRWKGD